MHEQGATSAGNQFKRECVLIDHKQIHMTSTISTMNAWSNELRKFKNFKLNQHQIAREFAHDLPPKHEQGAINVSKAWEPFKRECMLISFVFGIEWNEWH
eukprot:227662_1